MDKRVFYKSRFSVTPFIVGVFGFIFLGIISMHFMKQIIGSDNDSIVLYIFTGVFCFFSIIVLLVLLTLKYIEITKDYLFIKYIFLFKEVKIPWHTITKVRMKVNAELRGSNDEVLRAGKEVKIYTEKKVYSFESSCYSDFNELSIQIKKRLNIALQKQMVNSYKATGSKFWKEEMKYHELRKKYLLPISIAGIILLIIYKMVQS